ncbi:MAG TPA: hypothetical protein VJO16_17125 [Candidatus Acidoferrum sp.]|nr:hypothetical protein [Candidatus Acidoferrum sp.]
MAANSSILSFLASRRVIPARSASRVTGQEVVVAFLLWAGLYFPNSIGGVQNSVFFAISLAFALCLLSYLAWRDGTRPRAVTFISLPIMIILIACTFSLRPIRFGWADLALYSLLALMLTLDLRRVYASSFVHAAFVAANLLNIASGIAILIGSEWMGQFLSAFYTQFYPELVKTMADLHKPVLTFGTHAAAGIFSYVFFWLNWETYKAGGKAHSLFFALCQFILLVALTSFTSFALAGLALVQMGTWFWKYNRKALVAAALFIMLVSPFGVRFVENQIADSEARAELTGAFLNSEISGPLGRYGEGGSERGKITQLLEHPLSPLGLAMPAELSMVDSGPLEYLLRGSVPLLVLIYFGLYRFLRYNLASRSHALTLFLLILTCEAGFTLLIYVRTLYLLPFFVIYLNQIVPVSNEKANHFFFAGM